MSERPLSVTIVAWVYLAAGAVGFAYHLPELAAVRSVRDEAVWISFVRLLAVVAGVYLLRGRNWARWLALAWIAFHVVVSALHSWTQAAVHAVLCGAIAYALFHSRASNYFRKDRPAG